LKSLIMVSVEPWDWVTSGFEHSVCCTTNSFYAYAKSQRPNVSRCLLSAPSFVNSWWHRIKRHKLVFLYYMEL
jgi:hypothetical protein